MRLRSAITSALVLAVLLCVSPALAAVPTVTSFTLPATCVSPVPVTAFAAADSDGAVVGYMITTTSQRPAAGDARWTTDPWTSFATTRVGSLTLYAWAKDDAGGVSNSRSAATTVLGPHHHDAVYVNEGQVDSITEPMIAAGAVTDVAIAGPIAAAKISGTVADADTVDGKHASDLAAAVHAHDQAEVNGLAAALAAKAELAHAHAAADVAGLPAALDAKADAGHAHDGLYQQRYAGLVVVAKSGGDFSDPIAAIDAIADASADKPYLLKVMPGVYDLGANGLVMKEYVDLEGSGENTTFVMSSAASTVTGAANAEIRSLSLGNVGGGNGIANAVKVTHVTVVVTGAENGVGVATAYDAVLKDVLVDVSGTSGAGISSSIRALLEDVTVKVAMTAGATGVSMNRGTLKNSSVTVTGGTSGQGLTNSGGPSIVKGCTLTVSAPNSGGIYMDIYANLNIADSAITVTGTAGGAGGLMQDYGNTTMTNTTLTVNATGGDAKGYTAWWGNLYLTNSAIVVKGGTNNYGLYYFAVGRQAIIERSTLEASSYSVFMEHGDNTIKIAGSKVVGAMNYIATCVNSYNGNFLPLSATCQ